MGICHARSALGERAGIVRAPGGLGSGANGGALIRGSPTRPSLFPAEDRARRGVVARAGLRSGSPGRANARMGAPDGLRARWRRGSCAALRFPAAIASLATRAARRNVKVRSPALVRVAGLTDARAEVAELRREEHREVVGRDDAEDA